MASRAIVVAFHRYTPFGAEFYEPILDFFVQSMKKYKGEYDKIYFVDSTWDIDIRKLEGLNAEIVKVDPHLRYYDAYKEILPDIKEDLVLFMDNDMVVYKKGVIDGVFEALVEVSEYPMAVASIYDTIGSYETNKMNGKNKLCPYWFAARTDLLKKYLDVYWGSNMPEHETLGKLTEVMLDDGVHPVEQEEDKSNCLFDGSQDGEKSKDLGYYHIRAGSTPAYLLATKTYGEQETYWKYIKEQPRGEYLRQLAWYRLICCESDEEVYPEVLVLLQDAGVGFMEWEEYFTKFLKYHGLT